MCNKKIQLLTLFITTFFISANAIQQSLPASQQPAANPSKVEASAQTEGTYRDEIEIIKFDENTGRDSYAIPFDENALEPRPKNKPAPAK